MQTIYITLHYLYCYFTDNLYWQLTDNPNYIFSENIYYYIANNIPYLFTNNIHYDIKLSTIYITTSVTILPPPHKGEAAGIAMGLVMLGTKNQKAIEDMLTYAQVLLHNTIYLLYCITSHHLSSLLHNITPFVFFIA